jgi:plasmid stabilization system protein ParE
VSYPVTLRPRAENDIRTIFEWYESQQSKFPYLVFYIVEAKRVVVLAVLHTSRDPAVWPRG